MTTIALCMIVRNEAAVIDRCLKSVRDLIDTWVICDTGSSDGTQRKIKRALKGIPGVLHETEWVDFGHNRSELLERSIGAADYLLLLDADHVVTQRAPLPRLKRDAYTLRELGALDYAVVRLVRGDREWWYEGSTHEYLATDGQFSQDELDVLLLEHGADGGNRTEKLLRDVGLLKRDLADDPSNGRAVFYLAQTYRDMGRRELAIRFYRQRAQMGGWDEEAFYARLMAGTLMLKDLFDEAIAELLRAWQLRPTRAEPLYEVARAHRLHGQHDLAELYAARGLAVPYPTDVLFIHRETYEWGLRLEHGLALAGLGRYDEARAALKEVLEAGHLPAKVQQEVAAALKALPGTKAGKRARAQASAERLSAVAPSLRIGEIKIDVTPEWPAFNPSIVADGDGFRMVVRTANYFLRSGIAHQEGILHNLNYLVRLNAALAVETIEPIVDVSTDGPRRYRSQIHGYEDIRLFEVAGEWYGSATVCDFNPRERREIALLRFAGADIVSVSGLPGPDPTRHEKNWMPLVRGDQLCFVYSCRPTVVLGCDPATGRLETVAETPAPVIADNLRGGSQGVGLDDGSWLFAVHETGVQRGVLRYVHRFVQLGADLSLTGISVPFTFTTDPVEFCAGMARRGAELVLSFGVSDAAAGLAALSIDDALALVEPVARRRRQAVTSRRTS
ncbi:MAG: hypothetical protein QOF76_1911 [Solirubrobacteraceae bacterium]|nr:hypothetical protein [Solirubrobacteraceae bacterium]